MGRLLRESPANSQLLGGGLRAGTLRSRVRVIQKFIVWLTTAHNVAFPLHRKHLIEYFQVRLSKRCVRGSLKLLHTSFILLQEVAGIQDRFTDDALYDVTSALPGKPPSAGATFSHDSSGSAGRQCDVAGYSNFLESHVLVAVIAVLGNVALGRSPRNRPSGSEDL